LVRAWRVWSPERVVRGPRAWVAVADAVEEAVPLDVDEFIIEGQQYDARTGNAAKDVIELGGVVQRLIARLAYRGAEAKVLLPREWIGSTPKAVRLARVKATLSAEEFANVESWDEDTVDATALGLWAAKKAGERR
jgi:hypothetical protein